MNIVAPSWPPGSGPGLRTPDGSVQVTGLLARVHVVHALAAPAANKAAPHELALAALHVSHHVRVVSPAAAQQVAVVRSGRGPVAAASSGSGDATPAILHAVVRRLVDEDELFFVGRVPSLVLPPGLPPAAVPHLHAAFVALLQVNAHALKRRHRPPARPHSARAGDSVTATVCRHRTFNRLEDRGQVSGHQRGGPALHEAESGSPHLPPGLAVVLVHGEQREPSSGHRRVFHTAVDEPAAEPGTVLDVVRAAAPVPALGSGTGGTSASTQPRVAAALRHVALTAGARDGVDQPCGQNRVDKRRLLGSYWTRDSV